MMGGDLELKPFEADRVIWKYQLDTGVESQEVEMPFESRILHVAGQEVSSALGPKIVPTMWVMVDAKSTKRKRVFKVVATGQPFKIGGTRWSGTGVTTQPMRAMQTRTEKYIGTAQCGSLAWHIFEDLDVG